MTGHYLTRYAYPVEFLGEIEPSKDLGIVVAIPCFAEENLLNTLQSILECSNPGINVEVIVVINHPANSPGEIVRLNESTFSGATAWSKEANSDWLRFHFIRAFDLPPKIAGVGLARKIAMDEAVRRFIRAGNPHGIIASMDADCTCEKNYLEAIKSHFRENPQSCGANIYFEHNLYEGDSRTTNLGILYYELHLRYMVHALRFADFPYAFHTIGSCMAIPVNIYQKQGGMNTRKAGEDFYF
ncbi:MAG TPA: glycosyltransferase, partial [Cyclobacteriaceae bacterium]|nr:glycosyltransferase [Cyclobacteriaceae bacterium]